MDDEVVFPERWDDLRGRSKADADRRDQLERELRREVAPDHALSGADVVAVAACTHCDDVLFQLTDGRYAIVHLSYPQVGPDRSPWPATDFYDRAGALAYVEDHADA